MSHICFLYIPFLILGCKSIWWRTWVSSKPTVWSNGRPKKCLGYHAIPNKAFDSIHIFRTIKEKSLHKNRVKYIK